MNDLKKIITEIEEMPDLLEWHVENLKRLALPSSYEEIDWDALMKDCGYTDEQLFIEDEWYSLKREAGYVK